MVLKAEVLKVLESGEDFVRVLASYCRGHKYFSPRGFEYTFKERKEPIVLNFPSGNQHVIPVGTLDEIEVGMIWDIGWFRFTGEITKWPDDTEPIVGKRK